MSATAIALAAALVITSTPAEVTYYHDSLAGEVMANGERYDPNAMVCAANSYEFGTRIRITNRATGRSTLVTVTDRGLLGPVNVDLSPRAFREIGDLRQGRIDVWIEEIN